MMKVLRYDLCMYTAHSYTAYYYYVTVVHTVSVPIRHSLPDVRTMSKFGSSEDGNCLQIRRSSNHSDIYRGSICDGTSVLNDGIIPALSNVSNASDSHWAAQLLIMKQDKDLPIVLSFEVENQSYDCMQLAVFNCPNEESNMNVRVYSDTMFRPQRDGQDPVSLGDMIKDHFLSNTSCNYLLKFYVSFNMSNITTTFFNIEFPGFSRVKYVLVGEVSFLSGTGGCEQWPTELIQTTNYVTQCTLG